jgi:peptide/nickel transport system ATP-binding protein
MCDEVAIVYAGEIVEMGTREDIFDHPTHPYTNGLFGAVPNLEEDVEFLKPIDGMPPDPTNLPEGCKFHPRCPHATDACRQKNIALKNLSETHKCRCMLTGEA